MIPTEPEARKKMISYMLDGLSREAIENDWEREFIESITEQFEVKQNLTNKQCEILERIYNKVC